MKTRTWILIFCALALALGVSSAVLLWPGEDAAAAEVYSEGRLVRTVDLRVDQVFTVESARGTNVVTVADGKIAVTAADCPDGWCMARGYCAGGARIVCLPNRLVISFAGSGIDGISG